MDRNEQVTIMRAMDRSRGQDRIVEIDWDAHHVQDVVDYIQSTYEGDVDWEVGPGRDVTDIWGWTPETDEDCSDFRLYIRAVPNLGGQPTEADQEEWSDRD